LADALDLGSSAARHVGSTPIIRTQTSSFRHNGRIFFTNPDLAVGTQKQQNGYSS
jgi:hypothetical protein